VRTKPGVVTFTALLFALSLLAGLSSAFAQTPEGTAEGTTVGVAPADPSRAVEPVHDDPAATAQTATEGTVEAADGAVAASEGVVEVADAPTEEAPAAAAPASPGGKLGVWQNLIAIFILLVVVGVVIARLPRVEGLGHTEAFRKRRVGNWLPLGLTYAFLYMARYNLTVSKNALSDVGLMDNADFGVIFGIGTLVYGVAFLINGPLTDRYGGKATILVGAAGSLIANLFMGVIVADSLSGTPGAITNAVNAVATPIFGLFAALFGALGLESGNLEASPLMPSLSLLYGANMYFQSFGAVAIVKVNAPWFHVRERGVFGAIFGILISLGVYFAYDWNGMLLAAFPGETQLVFFVPAALLGVFFVVTWVMVKDNPSDAGFADFDTADASSGDDGPRLPALKVFKMMLSNKIILIIAFIEFCSGFLRQAIMQWGKIFAKQTGLVDHFVNQNWGLLLCCAGILGGVFAGTISDHLFNSRRGPVAAVLYAAMLAGSLLLIPLLGSPFLMWMLIFLSICIIGVHGMLSGTASMDFGGKKNAGIAVGIIDGFVYLGTAVMSFWYGWKLPKDDAAADPGNWMIWPVSMIPIALLGLLLATRVWNAKPKGKVAAH
jgi:OPA family glycerol-3-phosphate transporter-like MFS transporter